VNSVRKVCVWRVESNRLVLCRCSLFYAVVPEKLAVERLG